MVNDHYPVFKWLFHWEYTLFSDKPIWVTIFRVTYWPFPVPQIDKTHLNPMRVLFIIAMFVSTPWWFNIATENNPFMDGLPIKKGDFP